MMGLVIALRLAQAGRRVTLYEASETLGGLAAPWELDDAELGKVTWDRHYHVTLLSDSYTRGVLRDVGVEDTMRWVETRTGYHGQGKLVSMSNALEYLGLPGMSLPEKVRVAGTILYGSRVNDWRTLENVPVQQWLTQLSGAGAFKGLWQPLLEAKLGDAWRDSSAAFIWATIQRLYAARRTGLKKEMFGYVPGGYRRVVDAFGEKLRQLGVVLKPGVPVKAVRRAGEGVAVDSDQGTERFDRAVLTVTPRAVSRLCPELSEAERGRFEGVPYQGVVCASLLLDAPLADYYLTYLMDEGLPFTAVVEMSTFVDREEFGGRSLVYLPRYAAATAPVFGMGDDEIREQFLRGLERLYPKFRRQSVRAFRVSRAKEVFPLPTLGYSTRLPPTTPESLPGVVAISSAHIVNGTLNVNDTVRIAERASKSLLLHDGKRLFLD